MRLLVVCSNPLKDCSLATCRCPCVWLRGASQDLAGVLSNTWLMYGWYSSSSWSALIFQPHLTPKDLDTGGGLNKVLWAAHEPACGQAVRKPVCSRDRKSWLTNTSCAEHGQKVLTSSETLAQNFLLALRTCEIPSIFATTPFFSLSNSSCQLGQAGVREPWPSDLPSPGSLRSAVGPAMSQSEFEKHLHIQTGPLPWPLTLQWACGLLVWAGRTNLLKASTSTRFHGEGRKGVGVGNRPPHWVSVYRLFHLAIFFKESLCLLLEVVWICGPELSLGKSTSARIHFFSRREKTYIYIASPFLNCASLAKEFHSDNDAMNGAVIMGFRRAQSPTTGIVPLTAELELCLL